MRMRFPCGLMNEIEPTGKESSHYGVCSVRHSYMKEK